MLKKHSRRLYLFLLPLLALLMVFSFYPILRSFVYSFFDYRTNDPSHNELRLRASLNGNLLAEDASYLSFYLDDDLSLFPHDAQEQLLALGREGDAIAKKYKNITAPDDNEMAEIRDFIQKGEASLKEIYGQNPNPQLSRFDDLQALFREMKTCFIEPNYLGFAQYLRLLKDTRFFGDLSHTLLFTTVSVTLELLLGMILALIMNAALRGIGLVRTAALIPWAIPTAVSALIWQYLYDGQSGIVARFFTEIGLIASPEVMLSGGSGAMAAAIIADIWKTTPYMALLLLAGLQVIDRGLYESASMDGAGAVRSFFRITLPLMKPSILVALLFRSLDAFRVYDLIFVLTGGGPGGATETLSIYSYKIMIEQNNYGYGSAIVVGMFLCVALIAFAFIKLLGAELMGDDEN